MLIDSGFAPEWISLDKEIRHDIKLLRQSLLTKRAKLGPSPLAQQASAKWEQFLKDFHEKLININKKIDKFNVIVPILNKQKVHFNYEKEVKRIIEDYIDGKNMEMVMSDVHPSTGGGEYVEQTKAPHSSITLAYVRRLMERCRDRLQKRLDDSPNTSGKS